MKKLVFTAFALIVFISCSVQKHELQHEPTEMTVMTFNIRLDHAGDKENNWKFRKERVVKNQSNFTKLTLQACKRCSTTSFWICRRN